MDFVYILGCGRKIFRLETYILGCGRKVVRLETRHALPPSPASPRPWPSIGVGARRYRPASGPENFERPGPLRVQEKSHLPKKVAFITVI